MNNISYSKAYTQVLVLLENLPKNEYNKIPKSEIDFFERNKDENYAFTLNYSKPLEQQDISIQANSMIVRLFKDYFATESQKIKLELVLKSNSKKAETAKRNKYNPSEIFKRI